ncbi:hypothetical protein, partial [Mycolicibacterium iranicum]
WKLLCCCAAMVLVFVGGDGFAIGHAANLIALQWFSDNPSRLRLDRGGSLSVPGRRDLRLEFVAGLTIPSYRLGYALPHKRAEHQHIPSSPTNIANQSHRTTHGSKGDQTPQNPGHSPQICHIND